MDNIVPVVPVFTQDHLVRFFCLQNNRQPASLEEALLFVGVQNGSDDNAIQSRIALALHEAYPDKQFQEIAELLSVTAMSDDSDDSDDEEATEIAKEINVDALFVAVSGSSEVPNDAKVSVNMLELHYHADISGADGVTRSLVKSMCKRHGCEPRDLLTVIPGYAKCLRDIVERKASSRFDATLASRADVAFKKNDATAARFKNKLEKRVEQMKAEIYLDLAQKLEEVEDDMLAQLELFDIDDD
jgi:hypothetical protein